MTESTKQYDLEERTAKFAEDVIKLCKSVNRTTVSYPIVTQLVRSATSIGANYMEANGASSKKDFRVKIHHCKKEAQETRYWIRMLGVASPELLLTLETIKQESRELVLIFGKISASLKQ